MRKIFGCKKQLCVNSQQSSIQTPNQIKIGNHSLLTFDEEKQVIDNILKRQIQQNCLSNSELRVLCSKLYFERTGIDHYFDSHWLSRFCERYSSIISKREISLHDFARATVTRKQIIDFYLNLNSVLSTIQDFGLVINMDETGFMSKPQKGKKMKCLIFNDCEILPFRTARPDYRDISLASAITLDGHILKNTIITSRKTLDSDLLTETDIPEKFKIIHTESGYMNEEAMIIWILEVLKPYIISRRTESGIINSPALLILDNCPTHKTERVQAAFNEIPNLNVIFLPPNATHLLQPLDLFFFIQLKLNYQQSRRHKNMKPFTEKLLRIQESVFRCSSGYIIGLSWNAMGIIYNFSNKNAAFNFTKVKEIILSQPE